MMRLIFEQIIEGAAALMREHKDELISLDQAIGDGDHGINMHRGFAALLAEKEAIAVQPLGAALKKAGMILVMKVGGASGPLYGSLFMGMGKGGTCRRRAHERVFCCALCCRCRGGASPRQGGTKSEDHARCPHPRPQRTGERGGD